MITTAESGADAAYRCTILAANGEVLMKSDDYAMDGIRSLWWICGRGVALTTLEAEHLPAKVLYSPVAPPEAGDS